MGQVLPVHASWLDGGDSPVGAAGEGDLKGVFCCYQ